MRTFDYIFEILKYVVSVIGAATTITAFIFTISKKARKKFKNFIAKMSDKGELLEDIKKLSFELKKIGKDITELNIKTDKINDKLKNNDEATILTVKYEILSICHRARKYKGITMSDKEVLGNLYKKYVEDWGLNHGVKSEADFILNNLETINSYEDES